MNHRQGEYAQAGVDYTKIGPFKEVMQAVGKRTLHFPNRRNILVLELAHSHGAVYQYTGSGFPLICQTTEGLGNKNWIAEWMRKFAGTGRSYYEGIGIDTALMAVNDLIAQGAMPIGYTDEVAAGDDDWFTDQQRAGDLGQSYYEICNLVGMALPAGESPALRYLIKAMPPVDSAPSLSGCAIGLIANPDRLITGERLAAGDVIIGASSSGLHANGISLVNKRALTLPDAFLSKLPNGNTLGDEALIPTRSYVALVEALQEAEVDIHALAPITGDGVSKMAFDKRPFTYVIGKDAWPKTIPHLFLFMRELGVSIQDCLKTFNWGIGYCAFVPKDMGNRTMDVGTQAGYEMYQLGEVIDGPRGVDFQPEGLFLPPPGE